MESVVQFGATIAIYAGSGGVVGLLGEGSALASAASGGLELFMAATNVSFAGRGLYDMAAHGVTWQSVLQVGLSGFALKSQLSGAFKGLNAAEEVAPDLADANPEALSWEQQELQAQQRLLDYEGGTGSHFLARHSPLTTLSDQEWRALTGITPAGEALGYTTNSTRFLSYTDMDQALSKALAAYDAAGISGGARLVIGFNRVIGEGFYANTAVYGQATHALAGFNEFGQVYTLFPVLP
jgi:hypothetical protein